MSTDSLSPQTQRSESRLAVETVGLDVIAEADRKGKPADLFMPWFAANISVLGISWGSMGTGIWPLPSAGPTDFSSGPNLVFPAVRPGGNCG